MFLHPDLRDARPLMVVGAPRCGTRFVADALNRHPSILLQGEIPTPAMRNAIRFLSGTGDLLASMRPNWSRTWERSRRDLLYAIWASMQKGESVKIPVRGRLSPILALMFKGTPWATRQGIRWFGHKTPRHDQYWKFYRDFFGETRPKYVFCMRNFVDHYLSMSSMKDHRGTNHIPAQERRITNVARHYRTSVSRYAEMKAALGESVSLFILDDLHEGGIEYVRETLFERLEIEVDDQTLSRIDVSRRANSTEGAGASRRKELTADEQIFLEENPDLMDGLVALRTARPLAPATGSAHQAPRQTAAAPNDGSQLTPATTGEAQARAAKLDGVVEGVVRQG